MYFSLYSVCTYKPIHYSSNYQISMVLLHLFINFPCLLSRCLQCENSNWIGFLFKWQACATTGVKPEPWSANILWIDEFWAGGVTAYCLLKMGLNLFWNCISILCCSCMKLACLVVHSFMILFAEYRIVYLE